MGGIEDEFNTISSEHDTEQFLAAANHSLHTYDQPHQTLQFFILCIYNNFFSFRYLTYENLYRNAYQVQNTCVLTPRDINPSI